MKSTFVFVLLFCLSILAFQALGDVTVSCDNKCISGGGHGKQFKSKKQCEHSSSFHWSTTSALGFNGSHINIDDAAQNFPVDGSPSNTTNGVRTIIVTTRGTLNPCTGEIEGGGNFEISDRKDSNNIIVLETGTFTVWTLCHFSEFAGALPAVLGGNPVVTLSGLPPAELIRATMFVASVRYSNGKEGSMTFGCSLPFDSPDGILAPSRELVFEGVTMIMGPVYFWEPEDPQDFQVGGFPPAASNTLSWNVGDHCFEKDEGCPHH